MSFFFQKIYFRNPYYCPPQTDILTYSKGGYGGTPPHIGGYTPCQGGGLS